MSDYKTEIQKEIEQEVQAIDRLYQRLRDEGTKALFKIYTEIASKQQSIEAKKQRLNSIDNPQVLPKYSIPSNVII